MVFCSNLLAMLSLIKKNSAFHLPKWLTCEAQHFSKGFCNAYSVYASIVFCIRDRVLPENIKNKLERHDKQRRHTKDNSERRNNHRHYKETKAKTI